MSLPESCLLPAPLTTAEPSSDWNIPMQKTERQAGREGEKRGGGRPSQTFLGKNKGKFQSLECHFRGSGQMF